MSPNLDDKLEKYFYQDIFDLRHQVDLETLLQLQIIEQLERLNSRLVDIIERLP